MSNGVLVAYATATGSTAEVAATVAETLVAGGLSVDLQPITGSLSVESYQAVLIGSAVQHGQWLPEAIAFVRDNQHALSRVPLALFTVHIQNLGSDAKSQAARETYLSAIRPLVQPIAEAFFGGRFNQQGAALLMPGVLSRLVPTTDLRNWEEIRAWADSLSPLLREALEAPGTSAPA